jgi:hypothetical protein
MIFSRTHSWVAKNVAWLIWPSTPLGIVELLNYWMSDVFFPELINFTLWMHTHLLYQKRGMRIIGLPTMNEMWSSQFGYIHFIWFIRLHVYIIFCLLLLLCCVHSTLLFKTWCLDFLVIHISWISFFSFLSVCDVCPFLIIYQLPQQIVFSFLFV